eukprot:m.226747 g.226747  ORF g.226747 m.226747 type:complete len:260 (-) comp17023_c0_seq1:234-1013(-)
MVVIHHPEAPQPVIVDGMALPSLGSANTSLLEPHVPGEQRPLRRREPPPVVGRDNSATRYAAIKHRHHLLGTRRQRRWDNLLGLKATLETLTPVDEHEEAIVQPSHTVLTAFLSSPEGLERWEKLSSEENEIIRRLARLSISTSFEDLHTPQSPIQRYRSINRSTRTALRRRHLPMGIFAAIESDVLEAFGADPAAVLVLTLGDSFQRLMLHAICQYLSLESNSETIDGARVTTVKHASPDLGFVRPEVLLSAILASEH